MLRFYDTRRGIYDYEERFPIEGWLFPCFMCNSITSGRHYVYREDYYLAVPLCNTCELNNSKRKFYDVFIKK